VCHTATFAQMDIKTNLVFSDTVKTPFSNQWQYLSTDIYLFNGHTFNKLINDLNVDGTKERHGWFKHKQPQEKLEFLLLTAELKDVKLFGPNDLIYPIYNFQIDKDRDNKYQTFVSDNLDHVRIIDNLPLYSAGNFIDATIRARAITNNSRDEVLNLVAGQLKNLANLTNPTTAVFTLVGEFGSFLEASTRNKEYRFSSTIRLFEQKNFDTRLHSIRIYALTAGNNLAPVFDTEALQNFMDTTYNPTISRQLLSALIPYHDSPLIVVVNYKSLYRMEQISGDEVTAQAIDQRRLRIENEFAKGLISNETYQLERNFLDFLTSFNDLKRAIELYKLNVKVAGSNGTSTSLMQVVTSYRTMLKINRDNDAMNVENSTYATVFKPEYNRVQGYAGLYLEEDINLKNARELVIAINNAEAGRYPTKYEEQEEMLSKLHFADIFAGDSWNNSTEGRLTNAAISHLEREIYAKKYMLEVKKINSLKATDSNSNAPDRLQQLLSGTSCSLCRDSALVAIKRFRTTYVDFLRQKELTRKDSISRVVLEKSYLFLEKYQIIKQNLDSLYPNGSTMSPSMALLDNRLQLAKRDIDDLYDLSNRAVSDKPLEIIRELNRKMLELLSDIPANFDFICSRRNDLCVKQHPKPVKPKLDTTPALPDTIGVRQKPAPDTLEKDYKSKQDTITLQQQKSDNLPDKLNKQGE
ncbi:MAG TPA: hypothetical protein VMV56_01990, partial [Williamwhitmania sp.]|nr:hypothetical protein [Williamwhitmania sp.]